MVSNYFNEFVIPIDLIGLQKYNRANEQGNSMFIIDSTCGSFD